MNKRKAKVIVILIVILILCVGGYYIYNEKMNTKENEITEYTPEEEITEEQLRQTIITLYYKNKETNEVMPEARKVDVNILSKNPYDTLINMLMEQPKSDKMIKCIPEGTILNKVELKGDILYIDFSQEFIDNHIEGKEEENKTIKSIVNTVTELTEVNKIRIIIDGEENKEFKDKEVSFKEDFSRDK